MLKRMLAMLPAGLLLAVGCGTKPNPAPEEPEPANLRSVTLYVESMIQRQAIT